MKKNLHQHHFHRQAKHTHSYLNRILIQNQHIYSGPTTFSLADPPDNQRERQDFDRQTKCLVLMSPAFFLPPSSTSTTQIRSRTKLHNIPCLPCMLCKMHLITTTGLNFDTNTLDDALDSKVLIYRHDR
jgi:hypothetical protein